MQELLRPAPKVSGFKYTVLFELEQDLVRLVAVYLTAQN